jgi:hypothetical protein
MWVVAFAHLLSVRAAGPFGAETPSSLTMYFFWTELEKFMEQSQTPALGPYVQKLMNSRNRVANVNALLDRVMQRIDRINTLISTPDTR